MPVTATPHAPARLGTSRPGRRARHDAAPSANVALLLILSCQLMIVLDASIVITALPKIQGALHFSSTNLSWVQNAYTLTFGGLLLLGARAGDILGRRRIFMAGIAAFALASLAGGLAQSAAWLLIARAVQGIAAAVAAPSTLALLMERFTEPRARLRAIALFSMVSGAGISLGLVLGGLLTDLVSWRWGLFVNVPIGILLVVGAPKYLPGDRPQPGRFDLTGAITSTLGMGALVYGFVRAASDGWRDTGTIFAFVGGVVLLASFVATERRAEQPVMPLRLFASRERSGAYVTRLLVVGGMFGSFFFLTQYLQDTRGFSPLQAGFAFLPMTAAMFAMIQVVPRLARIANWRLMAGGIGVALVGMALLSRIGEHTAYLPAIGLPLILVGIGMGTAFIPLTSAGIAGVPPQDAGAASGLVNVSQQVGGTLGLAILVTVFGAAGGAGRNGANLAHAAGVALTGSAILLAVALLVTIVVGRRTPAAAPASPETVTREPDLAA